jgi:hypothetical protein
MIKHEGNRAIIRGSISAKGINSLVNINGILDKETYAKI